MTVQEKNYWLTTGEMPGIETGPLPEKVDVAILGAGFTGLSAARTLAKLGARVAVLEAETVGWGASSRNGGMVLSGLKLGASDLISRYGKEMTRRMFAASLEAISTVEQIVADEKIDCDFWRCGHLEVANKPSHFDAFEHSAETMERELNHSVQIVPRNRMIYNSLYYTHYYRLTPDRRMLFGGRAAFFPENENTIRESQSILRRDMVQIFPQLAGIEIDYVWGGTLDFAFDMMPHAGKMDGLYYSVGYAGHGVAMATLLGHKMAERIASGSATPEANPFAEIPFKGAPLGVYRRKPWFLPLAGLWFPFLDIVS